MERKSRHLSYILRHRPESIGIKLDEHAYGDVQKDIRSIKHHNRRLRYDCERR